MALSPTSGKQGGLTAKERAFLDENFKRFGTAWAEGLSQLEEHFEVHARTPREGTSST